MIAATALFCFLLGAFIGGLITWKERSRLIDHWITNYNYILDIKNCHEIELGQKRSLVECQGKRINDLRQKLQKLGLWLYEEPPRPTSEAAPV
jgi:hypothetical protein